MLPNTIPPTAVTGIDQDTLDDVLAEMTEIKVGDDIALSEIATSLAKRGFLDWPELLPDNQLHSITDVETQTFAVIEEIAELARLARRMRTGVIDVDIEHYQREASDVIISAVCLGFKVAGPHIAMAIREKLAADEKRGWLHAGNP